MSPELQRTPPLEPRVFQHSLDWRFLLPLADPMKMCIAFNADPDFSAALERIGIPVSNQLCTPDFPGDERGTVQAFVLPFGLPVHWISAQQEEQVEFYRSIRAMLCPDGYLLLGFDNSRNSHSPTGYHASTPPHVTDQLNRAGFGSTRILGAMPNLHIPEYIFELNNQAIYFALKHRFRRKSVLLNMLGIFARTASLARLSDFFPCYFAVAIV